MLARWPSWPNLPPAARRQLPRGGSPVVAPSHGSSVASRPFSWLLRRGSLDVAPSWLLRDGSLTEAPSRLAHTRTAPRHIPEVGGGAT